MLSEFFVDQALSKKRADAERNRANSSKRFTKDERIASRLQRIVSKTYQNLAELIEFISIIIIVKLEIIQLSGSLADFYFKKQRISSGLRIMKSP